MTAVSTKRVYGTQGFVRIKDVNEIWTPTSTQKYHLGTPGMYAGKSYRYCYATEALYVCAIATWEEDADALAATAIPTAAIGVDTLAVTLAAQTKNEHSNRILAITAGTGLGYSYRIQKNAATSGTTCSLTLSDPIKIATSATDSAGAIYNDAYVVQESNAANPVAEVPICVAPVAVTTEYYFWGQTRGQAQILADTAGITAGQGVFPGEANGGRGQVIAQDQQHTCPVGYALTTATAGVKAVVFLTLD